MSIYVIKIRIIIIFYALIYIHFIPPWKGEWVDCGVGSATRATRDLAQSWSQVVSHAEHTVVSRRCTLPGGGTERQYW